MGVNLHGKIMIGQKNYDQTMMINKNVNKRCKMILT